MLTVFLLLFVMPPYPCQKGEHVHRGGFMLITITRTGNLCLQCRYEKNELVFHVTIRAFLVDIRRLISWTSQLFYIDFLPPVSLLDSSLAPSTLTSSPGWCLFSLKPSSPARALQLIFHRDVLTSLMVLLYKNTPPSPPQSSHPFLY